MVVGACAHNQTQRAPPLLPRWAPPWPQVPRRVFCCFVVLPRQHLTTPHRTAPYHTTFHRIAPHRTAQHFTARHRTAPYRTASHRTAPHRNLSTNPTHTSPHHATRMPHCISPVASLCCLAYTHVLLEGATALKQTLRSNDPQCGARTRRPQVPVVMSLQAARAGGDASAGGDAHTYVRTHVDARARTHARTRTHARAYARQGDT